MNSSKKRSFWSLIVTQYFGAFNDNIFKTSVALFVIKWVTDPIDENNWKTASMIVFGAPFLMFSLVSGRLADRYRKSTIIRYTKVFELFVVIICASGILLKNIPVMIAGLFLLASQSAFFGPSKYGILPELVDAEHLPQANAYLNMFTFIAILTGSVLGTLLIENPVTVVWGMAASAVLGLVASATIKPTPVGNPNEKIKWNPIPNLIENWALIKNMTALQRSMIAVTFFWFLGAVLQINTLSFVEELMGGNPKIAAGLLTVIVIGISIGSLLAAKLSKGKPEIGLVPVGGIGMSLFMMDLYWAAHSHQSGGIFSFLASSIPVSVASTESTGLLLRVALDMFLLSLSSGLFVVPLNTLIQSRSPSDVRGKVLATVNFFSFVAVIIAGVYLFILGSIFKYEAHEIFLALSLTSFASTALVIWMIPQSLVRFIFYCLTNSIYRIRVVGAENVPQSGPALLVPNHVSMVDPFLISAALPRLVRFLMFRDFYDKPIIHPIVKIMEAIPISEKDNPKDIMRSLIEARKKLEEGHLVCIFAEGQISRLGGVTLGFKRGVDVIIKGLDQVPVIPVHLEGVWGSMFSFIGNKFIWKRPREIPYPVTVTFGKPLFAPSANDIRQSVMDLGTEAFSIHRQKNPTLFESFVSKAKRFPARAIVADSGGQELTYRKLLIASTLCGKKLREHLGPKRSVNIGILLPPTVAAVVANIGSLSEGFVAINLNYTQSKEILSQIIMKAQISSVMTSRKMLEKTGYSTEDLGNNVLFIEDLMSNLSTSRKLLTAIALSLLPSGFIKRVLFPNRAKNLDELATILFTSGSTGVPKGACLTHGNILANIQAFQMVLQTDDSDALMGVLPFFHSFGFTGCLWFPLLSGFKTVYHTNPLDSKTIGDVCERHKATFLMGTPTFITAYMRRIDKMQFASLRFAIVGAEKLRPELAQAFEQKYGVPILEGYGCTELSPMVALNVPDIMDGDVFQVGRKVGKIGRPVPGVSVKVVDPESLASLENGKEGLLMVKGPNVMKGYLGEPEKTAEVIKDGWYITGDIATIDEDGFIEITDRLSRFSKIGGEMVPHIKVEQKLHELAGLIDRTFVVTGIPDEKKGESLVVLVAGFNGDLDPLWKALNASELPKLWIPARDQFITIESFPVLGSGKVDMQKIKMLCVDHFHSRPS